MSARLYMAAGLSVAPLHKVTPALMVTEIACVFVAKHMRSDHRAHLLSHALHSHHAGLRREDGKLFAAHPRKQVDAPHLVAH